VSQIMSHVRDNIGRLPTQFQDNVEIHAQSGDLKAPDPQVLLAELKQTYVMADQHVIHDGGKVKAQTETEITFF
jgi:methyl-accepting chemotaxis protein